MYKQKEPKYGEGYYSYISDRFNDNRRALNERMNGSWWWLRSPGHNQYYAANVNIGGTVNLNGTHVSTELGVRPALWLNLES